MKFDYLIREIGTNLRRNFTLGLAATVTVTVSLAMVGVALVVQKGVDQATQQWQEGVEIIVFMNAEATSGEHELIRAELDSNPEVDRYRFVDQEEAYEEIQDLLDEQYTEILQPADMPTSYRVVPTELNANRIEQLADEFSGRPGVREVVNAQEAIRKLERGFTILRILVLAGGLVLLLISLLLIFNTIRMAMFARRREMEVMKLVGATNWFIRLPFMFEGLIQGLLGGALAAGTVWGYNYAIRRWLGSGDAVIALFQNFGVEDGFVWTIGAVLVAIGCAIGTIGSGIAVNRFLDV